ncbi:IRE (iron responsive element) [Rhodopirellula sp. MGV]|uniref:IRE (iron responsive element) n=1 Tax=Rhodopirellula sp. MGV TaxID=2023130 RepID=UPI000B96408A|nr:IRE (iron responsive element) [Rhodopirellula sp. MGV]OYP38387.1 IRE (iron responsive element) [Rhodopirellula sp. MGV]PNY34190.1 IRE (iron responsive element) [Rhodopirellula baltica]
MNQSTAFRRKIIYLVILVATLVPLYLLGRPSDGTPDSGGQLALMRQKYGISESDLGEISPASETMKLASLGLRGVAATLLWEKAHKYRVAHEWDRLKASLNNIALLQPHYDKVWEHQAHNLAYNVSIEFDDYRQRYEMVREGTEFLTRGVRQNRKAPRLIWYTGWFYGQKIGMSDEQKQFRRLFSEDKVLHASLANEGIAVDSNEAKGPEQKPDNWLVGRLWLNHGYDIVDAGVKIRRQSPINFFETGPKWLYKHAEAIEKEGVLDERAVRAYTKASEGWEQFGRRSIPTNDGFSIKLGSIFDLNEQKSEKMDEFRKIADEIYEEMRNEKIAALPIDVRNVLEKAPEERTEAGKAALPAILASVEPDRETVLKRLPQAAQLTAIQLIDEIKDLDERIKKTDSYRRQINFIYWESLAMAEQEERTVEARRLIYEAEKANADAEIYLAIEKYKQAFEIWAEIFDDYPILTIDDSAEDLFMSIRRYMIAIDSEDLPDDFPLATFARMMNVEGGIQNAEAYKLVREEQGDLAAKRKQELADEERARELEALKAAEEEAAADSDAEMVEEEPATAEATNEESVEATADADQAAEVMEAETATEATAEDATADDATTEEATATEPEQTASEEPATEADSESEDESASEAPSKDEGESESE